MVIFMGISYVRIHTLLRGEIWFISYVYNKYVRICVYYIYIHKYIIT